MDSILKQKKKLKENFISVSQKFHFFFAVCLGRSMWESPTGRVLRFLSLNFFETRKILIPR